VRPTRSAIVIAAGFATAAALIPLIMPKDAPKPASLAPPEEAGELVVIVRPGPVVYYPGPNGTLAGLDVDLAREFAMEKRIPLRFVLADSAAAVIAAVANGDAHFGAGGLFRPQPPIVADASGPRSRRTDAAAVEPDVTWTLGFATAEPVLIYNRDGYKPGAWGDLEGETVAYADDEAGLVPEIATARAAHPKIRWERLATPTAELISQVSDGTLSYAVVGSIAASLARNIYLDFEVAFPAGGKRDVAWAVSPRYARLREELDAFLTRLQRNGTLARLIERYIPATPQIQRIDAGVLHERIRTVLPQYRRLFQDAQERTGIEWRLLAAIAYQESQWDPTATSETGVRGFMQITEDTAKRLGISNLLDPAQNVLGAARYLRELKDKLPARIPEPERTWLALAAFNIGLGHLEDARILAQRQKLDPDLWINVKKVFPLLALPEHFGQAKLGYARGGMPVAFVDRVRAYYDVLLAQEEPHWPRLRRFTDAPERELTRLEREIARK
jgi:membrane-bound lytic murein transglycosylase F